ncbi:hypothetical protein PORY_000879 [Pneumocystis oryctolagi]|uniref:Uncharacterized protein n=1 Tax=Pneumocystis oryctolagi TaxID=42067 RepID=A0ACB7CG85_9ASCO|nr:hypothetical protein PORY_000879 [Pneumocystis oryctolagi]
MAQILSTPIITNALHIKQNTDEWSPHLSSYAPLSIDEVIRVVDSAIKIGLETGPLPVGRSARKQCIHNILDSLSNYMVSPLQKGPTQPPTYAPPSPPSSTQHSASTSISSAPSENPSSALSSMTLSNMIGHWLASEKIYVIELSIFQELLLRGALITQMTESSLETISRCISIFITASSSIINTFEMHMPPHLLHKTLINTLPIFTDTVLDSFESYISTYTLTLDDQYLSPENHKWLTIALYNCGIFHSASTKKSQWLLSSPLHRIKMYTRIFRKFLRILADSNDELSKHFSYTYQCFHLLLSKARGHIKMIREEIGQISPNNISMLRDLTNNIHEIEREVDCSRTRDLFTLEPKEYVLDLQPPQLPFIRSVIARSNFFFKMVHSTTGECIEKQIELILLTDIVIFLDIETPGVKFLMFQPFLTRIFKVTEIDEDLTFMLSFHEKEHIYLTATTKKTKKLWISMFSSTRAVQSVNYSTLELSLVGDPIISTDTHVHPIASDKERYRLSSELVPFKKIDLQPQLSKRENSLNKSHTRQSSQTQETNLPAIKDSEPSHNDMSDKNCQSMPVNQSRLSASYTFATYQNISEPASKPVKYMQKPMPRPVFNQSGLNIHSFPQPPDRTSNGLFPFCDKNSRSNNYSYSYIMPRMSKIRLETLPEENESFADSSKSPNINNDNNHEQKESPKQHIPCSKKSDDNSISKETSISNSTNQHSPTTSPKSFNLCLDSKEKEYQQSSSSQESTVQSSITESDTSISSNSTSQDSYKDKTESDIIESTEDRTFLSDANTNASNALTPKLPMPDLGRASLVSMIFKDSILGLSYSDFNIAKLSETPPNESNSNHTEILFRNSKLIDQLPSSFSSDDSEILFCEKAVAFFWNCTFWKSVFDPGEKVFLIIKYTCKIDIFTLEIYNLSSQEVVVCGELQKYSTIVRQAKQEISIACFIQDKVSYILSQFENDCDADLFYIILYRIINRDNPWILQVFQNHTPVNCEYNATKYPLNPAPSTELPKPFTKNTGSILNKSRVKVFFQTASEQWEYLGSGILWITSLDIDSKKHVLIAKKAKQNKSSTILNGIVSRSDCQRFGKTGVILKCFEELTNRTALYLIKTKNQKRTMRIINILNN